MTSTLTMDLKWNLPTTPVYEELNSVAPSEQGGPSAILTFEEYRTFENTVPALYFLLAPLGIATNIVNMYGFVKLGVTDSVSLTMFFLSLSDLILSLSQLINSFGTLFVALEENGVMIFSVQPFAIIAISGTMGINGYTSSSLITTCLALTRCLCVVEPLRFKSMFTVRRTLPVLILCLVFPHAFYIVAHIGAGIVMGYDPRHNVTRIIIFEDESRRGRHDAVIFVINLFLPFTCQVVTFVSVVFLIAGLRSTSAFRSSLNTGAETDRKSPVKVKFWGQSHGTASQKQPSHALSEKSAKSRRDAELHGKELRVARQVILISIIFIIFNMPAIMRSTGKLAVEEFSFGRIYNRLFQIASHAIVLSSMLNACTTLFIYLKFNTAFKNVFFNNKP